MEIITREASTCMDFSDALRALKDGKKLQRIGWNGSNMYVVMQKGYPQGIPCNKQTAEAWGINEGDNFICRPYLQIRNPDDSHSMWVPSVGDILADDWVTVDIFMEESSTNCIQTPLDDVWNTMLLNDRYKSYTEFGFIEMLNRLADKNVVVTRKGWINSGNRLEVSVAVLGYVSRHSLAEKYDPNKGDFGIGNALKITNAETDDRKNTTYHPTIHDVMCGDWIIVR
jgi:hypothetical protein